MTRARYDDGGPPDHDDPPDYCPQCRADTESTPQAWSPFCSQTCLTAYNEAQAAADTAWCDALVRDLAVGQAFESAAGGSPL